MKRHSERDSRITKQLLVLLLFLLPVYLPLKVMSWFARTDKVEKVYTIEEIGVSLAFSGCEGQYSVIVSSQGDEDRKVKLEYSIRNMAQEYFFYVDSLANVYVESGENVCAKVSNPVSYESKGLRPCSEDGFSATPVYRVRVTDSYLSIDKAE